MMAISQTCSRLRPGLFPGVVACGPSPVVGRSAFCQLISQERSESPKGERAKPDGSSLSCVLHRSRKADGIHYARNGSILPPVLSIATVRRGLAANRPPFSSTKERWNGTPAGCGDIKKDGERLATFIVSVKGESFVFAFGVMQYLQAFRFSLGGLATHDKQ